MFSYVCALVPSVTRKSSWYVLSTASVDGRSFTRLSWPVPLLTVNRSRWLCSSKVTEPPSGSKAGRALPTEAPLLKPWATKRATLPFESVRHWGASSTSVSSTTTREGMDTLAAPEAGLSVAVTRKATSGLVSKSNLPASLTRTSRGTLPPPLTLTASKSEEPSATPAGSDVSGVWTTSKVVGSPSWSVAVSWKPDIFHPTAAVSGMEKVRHTG
mmetsp:Transcript_139991/g.198345  ORF Transcript_139991/g.198345 Transcript_139991/m.198345 type:complete len:214 (+) Transcript_139991:3-644(+)